MKKKFVEPKIKRIELNLNENIANSSQLMASYHVLISDLISCTLHNTGEFMMNLMMAGRFDLIETCKVYINPNARIFGALVPEDEARSFMGGKTYRDEVSIAK